MSSFNRAEDRLIVALDVPSTDDALRLVDTLGGSCHWFKVGMELFYAAGAGIVDELRSRGHEVFLDLKLHDIPNTVAGAVRSVARTGASLLTVHAAGGAGMMSAALEAAGESPRLLGVTVLTSMDQAQLTAIGVDLSPSAQVLRLAHLAVTCGLRGLVCSAEEVEQLRQTLGEEILLVVPGIRPEGTDRGDQRRTATPAQALQRGASMLVVGRPIVRAADPAAAAERVLDEIREELERH